MLLLLLPQVVCGNRAGALTILLDHTHGPPEVLEGEMRPTHVVRSLPELTSLIQREYRLLPPPCRGIGRAGI